MRIPGEDTLHFIAVNQSADSLHSLIADQQYRPTSLGRETWKSLLGSEGSLQLNCNKEGFNVMKESNCSKARIGIISNNEIDCWTSDSGVGFGIGGFLSVNGTCGNVAYYEPDNGEKSIKTMGYIFIQWNNYYVHFKITGDLCNLIGSYQCDLFINPTIFFFFFALDRIIFSVNEKIVLKNITTNRFWSLFKVTYQIIRKWKTTFATLHKSGSS